MGYQPGRISCMKDMTWTCSNCPYCQISSETDISIPCWCDRYNKQIPWENWGEYVHPNMPNKCEKKRQMYLAKFIDAREITDEYTPVVTCMDASDLGDRVYHEDYESRDEFKRAKCCHLVPVMMRYLFLYHGYQPEVKVTQGDTPYSTHVEIMAVPPKSQDGFEGLAFINPFLMDKLKKNIEESLNKFINLLPIQQVDTSIDDPQTPMSSVTLVSKPGYQVEVEVTSDQDSSPVITVTKRTTSDTVIDDHHKRIETTTTKDIYTKA